MSNDPVPNNSGNTVTFIPTVNQPTYTLPGGIVYTIITTTGGGVTMKRVGGLSGPAPVVEKKKDKSGCACSKCENFNEYAIPNQLDDTFICYACRKGL